MDGIQSHLTPSERQELYRQFKCALRVKSDALRKTSRLYEWQLRRLQAGQGGIMGSGSVSRISPATGARKSEHRS